MYGSIVVIFVLSIIASSMFICTCEEKYEHNPLKEFAADLIFETKIRAGPESIENRKILREWARGE